jgi:chaperonin GroES
MVGSAPQKEIFFFFARNKSLIHGYQTQATSLRNIKALAPLLDRILVQRVKAEAKTATGIYLPESTVEKLSEAKVLAVGPGGVDKDGKRVEVSVKPGDKVLIPPVSFLCLIGRKKR